MEIHVRVTCAATANLSVASGHSPHTQVPRDAPDDESEGNPDAACETRPDRPSPDNWHHCTHGAMERHQGSGASGFGRGEPQHALRGLSIDLPARGRITNLRTASDAGVLVSPVSQ